MMKLTRAVVAMLVLLGGVLLGAQPAYAGGWATTVLDPIPDRFEPGRSYTIGFWVLQHGSHPYSGTLDPVGLQLVDAKGTATTYKGVTLPEAAHYVTSFNLPAAGTYTLIGLQGPFQPYQIGTLTVPGGLLALAVPPPLQVPDSARPWKEIRPPDMPVDPSRDPFDQEAVLPARAAPAAPATDAADAAETRPASSSVRPTASILGVLAITAAALGLLLYRRRRAAA